MRLVHWECSFSSQTFEVSASSTVHSLRWSESAQGLSLSFLANEFGPHRERLVDLAAKRRLPAMYSDRAYTEVGGLMSYGPDVRDNFRRSASYVDKILKGAKPADLPVEQPTKFEIVVNLKTAKALGLTIPRSVLLRTDQLIE